jgi:hypothetical protein
MAGAKGLFLTPLPWVAKFLGRVVLLLIFFSNNAGELRVISLRKITIHHIRGGMWTAPHHTNTLENKCATRNDKQMTLHDKLRCAAYAPHQAAP